MNFDRIRTGDSYEYDKQFGRIYERMYFLVLKGKAVLRDNNVPELDNFMSPRSGSRKKHKLILICNASMEPRMKTYITSENCHKEFMNARKTSKKINKKLMKASVIMEI